MWYKAGRTIEKKWIEQERKTGCYLWTESLSVVKSKKSLLWNFFERKVTNITSHDESSMIDSAMRRTVQTPPNNACVFIRVDHWVLECRSVVRYRIDSDRDKESLCRKNTVHESVFRRKMCKTSGIHSMRLSRCVEINNDSGQPVFIPILRWR